MRDFALTTDTQWAAYQKLWPVADKNSDILVSRMIPALSTLSTTGLPSVTTGLIGPGGISEALATTGGASTTFLETMATAISPDNITSIFTAAFTGAGGALGALKAIGSQLVGALSKHFLTPLSTTIFNGVKGIFMGGAGAAAGAVGGAAAGAGGAAAAGSGLGFSGIIAAIPGWGWAVAGGLAAAAFLVKFGPQVWAGVKSVFSGIGQLFGVGSRRILTQADREWHLQRELERTDPTRTGHTPIPGYERHQGGPVTAGQTYSTIPGEIFTPSTNGTVSNPGLIDYDKLGGGGGSGVAAVSVARVSGCRDGCDAPQRAQASSALWNIVE